MREAANVNVRSKHAILKVAKIIKCAELRFLPYVLQTVHKDNQNCSSSWLKIITVAHLLDTGRQKGSYFSVMAKLPYSRLCLSSHSRDLHVR